MVGCFFFFFFFFFGKQSLRQARANRPFFFWRLDDWPSFSSPPSSPPFFVRGVRSLLSFPLKVTDLGIYPFPTTRSGRAFVQSVLNRLFSLSPLSPPRACLGFSFSLFVQQLSPAPFFPGRPDDESFTTRSQRSSSFFFFRGNSSTFPRKREGIPPFEEIRRRHLQT